MFALFCLSVVCFVALGPWRALHGIYSYDFASLYGAARSWTDGLDPYDMRLVTEQVHRAGYDPARFSDYTPIQPSVYPPTALPLVALITWLPWEPARLVWACLSAVLFALSLSLLFLKTDLLETGKWWLVVSGVFCFSPASLGLSHGNPSVLSCSLTMLAVHFAMNGRGRLAALALGLAHCLKPQISIAAVVLFALWRYWRPLLLSFAYPAVAVIASALRAPSLSEFWHWLMSLQYALAASSSPGSINDPSPANQWGAYSMVNAQTLFAVWVQNPQLVNILTWLSAAVLVFCYLRFRGSLEGDNRFRDMAFFSALTLTVVYHRFYDEQLLLMVIPFLVSVTNKKNEARAVLWLFMLALLFPLHVVSNLLSSVVTTATPVGFILLRPLPVIVLGMCVLLIPWNAKAERMKEWTEGTDVTRDFAASDVGRRYS